MLLRNVDCPRCGATNGHLEGGLMLLCRHCGAVVELRQAAVLDSNAESVRRAYRAMLRPTEIDARMHEVTLELGAAQTSGDRDRYATAMREYCLLLPHARPELVPPYAHEDESAFRRWVETSVATGLVCTFGDIGAAAAGLDLRLVQKADDPVEGARAYLEAARRYARQLLEHPEYPADAVTQDPEQMARDMLRATLASSAALLPRGTVPRVLQALFGARTVEGSISCDRCGGPNDDADLAASRCRWCGAHFESDQDPWLASMMVMWEGAKQGDSSDERLAASALGILAAGIHAHGRQPEVEDALRFLREAIPHVEAAAIGAAASMMRHGYDARVHRFLDQLEPALADWVPSARPAEPAAGPRPEAPRTVEAAWDDPWVRTQLATWRHTGSQVPPDQVAMALVSMARLPLAMGERITAAQAAAFVLRAGPDVPMQALIDAAQLFGQAAAGPEGAAEREMLAELAAILRARQ